MTEFILFLTTFLLSYIGVEWFRRWSTKKQIYDIPNERSSHKAPVPRGGGLIFVIISILFYSVYTFINNGTVEYSYVAAAFLITSISWLDDLCSISVVWRFLVHAIATSLIIYSYGYIDVLYLPFLGTFETGRAGFVFSFLWIVWLTNAYNFMDGIDGIAGLQAVTAGLGWFLAGKMLGLDESAVYGGIIAFSCLGFLMHNWQPAKIFMGDVGSAFLGFSFAVLPLIAKKENPDQFYLFPVLSVVLVWFFVFDSAFTLFRRLLKKEKIWTAHREHIYQRLVIKGFTHRFVTILYGACSITVLILILIWLNYGGLFFAPVFILIFLQSLGLLVLSHRKLFVKTN
ncbi:MAG: tagO [Acidobacteria bacterium]|nr:tagO [Acidobacteriota bacterium]